MARAHVVALATRLAHARARGSKARARTGQNLIDHLLISFNFPFSSLCLLILPSFDFSLFGQTRLFEIPPIQVVFIPSSSYHRHHQYHLSLCPVRRPSTQLQPPRSQPIARPLLLQYPPPPKQQKKAGPNKGVSPHHPRPVKEAHYIGDAEMRNELRSTCVIMLCHGLYCTLS